MKRIILCSVFALSLTVFCAAQSQVSGGPFRQEGIASWYGAEFEGRPTASGEIFDPSLLTAAHPSLPFGTVLKVTNKHNNRTVTVRVNDRGPFVAARIIDLSRAAAEVLDMLSTGTAPVIAEAVPEAAPAQTAVQAAPDPPAAGPEAGQAAVSYPAAVEPEPPSRSGAIHIIGAMPAAESARIYCLQVGAYKIPRNAIDALEKLRNAGLNPAYEKSDDLYRVLLPGLTAGDIPPVSEKLKTAGFTQVIIRKE